MIAMNPNQTFWFVPPSNLTLPEAERTRVEAKFATVAQTQVLRARVHEAVMAETDEAAVRIVLDAMGPLIVRLCPGGGESRTLADAPNVMTVSEISELPQAYLAESQLAESDRKKSGWQLRFPPVTPASVATEPGDAKN